MTDRRSFLKTLAASGAFLTARPVFAFAGKNNNPPALISFKGGIKSVWQEAGQLPVWKDADVLVVGATAAGVAAASAAARNGANVFVISSLPYAGEDLCGSFLLWPKTFQSKSKLFGKVFQSSIAPLPLHVKSVLEQEMLDNGIDFLYSTQVSGVLTDEKGTISGICMANRSGIQAVRAKVIIDATPHASVARMAGVSFHPFKAGVHRFLHTVVGNELREDPQIINAEQLFPAFNTNNKSYRAIRYSIELPLEDESYGSLMKAEQTIRDITWDIEQGDSSDVPFYVPSSYMDSKNTWQPDNASNLYVIGPSSAFPRESAEAFLEPASIMSAGEEIGAEAARKAKSIISPSALKVLSSAEDSDRSCCIKTAGNARPVTPFVLASFEGGSVPVLGEYDVLVVGGGTAGAPATISAARNGSRVLVLEYLHGFGGVGTYGFIGRYTAGYRKGFTAEIDKAMIGMAPANHKRHVKPDASEWAADWKAEWYRQEIRKAGGDIWFHSTVCGTLMNGNRVEGVLVCTPFGCGVVRARCVVDSTGSADVAIAAGAEYEYTGKHSLAIQGAGLPKFTPLDHYNNNDWTFIDDTDIVDVTRLFIQCRVKNQGYYDIGKLPQTRERRRIVADYNVTVFDMMNKRTYRDTLSYHISNFDTHGYTEDVFFTVNPPDRGGKHYDVKMPLRSLLPKGMCGVIVTGLGSGAHRDAMPVVRMQPDLQNQGYAAGLVASEVAKAGLYDIRDIDMKAIQKRLVQKGTLPEEVLGEGDMQVVTVQGLERAVASLPNGYEGLEVILADTDKSVPALKKALKKASADDKIYYANVLCMLGCKEGAPYVLEAVKSYDSWDKGWNYRGMHQFGFSVSRLDNYVMALGKCGYAAALPEILRLASKLELKSEFSHFRAVSEALEQIKSPSAAPVLHSLLCIGGMTGHHIADQIDATRKVTLNVNDGVYILEDSLRNQALKEIFLARALYWCGDKDGLGARILENYASGQEAHYARFAWESLGKKS